MMRYYFTENRAKAVRTVLGSKKDFNPADYEKYEEIELAVSPDGRFSVWGNRSDSEESDLLRDTKPDFAKFSKELIPIADDWMEDAPLPDEEEEEAYLSDDYSDENYDSRVEVDLSEDPDAEFGGI